MKIPNKRELQQIGYNHSLDFYIKGLIKRSFTKTLLQKPYSSLVIDATLIQQIIFHVSERIF